MGEEQPAIAGVELGGTKCMVVLSREPGRIAEERRIATTGPRETLAAIERVLDGWRFDALGIASFGPLELDRGRADYGSLAATPKPGWAGTGLYPRLHARYGVPTGIETDVAGAAMAEQRWGAARGMRTHGYVTVGTGVGVGMIVDGRALFGIGHGEAGHMRIPRVAGDRFPGICSFHGDCVEGLVSGPAMAARAGHGPDARSSAGVPGAMPESGDPSWRLFVHDLAAMLHNLALAFAPERIAIGGGVVEHRDWLFPMLRAELADSLGGYGAFAHAQWEANARIGPPGLGPAAGPLGAIAVGLNALAQ